MTWDRLAEICGRYLGKGQQVALEGRIQTRTWDDDKGKRHWRTEIVASSVEMLSGRRRKDYRPRRPRTRSRPRPIAAGIEPDATEPSGRHGLLRRRGRRRGRRGGRVLAEAVGGLTSVLPQPAAARSPSRAAADRALERRAPARRRAREDDVDDHQEGALEPVRLAVEGDEGADADGDRHGGDLEG